MCFWQVSNFARKKIAMKQTKLNAPIDNDGWQTDWPTEPNTIWWFFGYPYGKVYCGQPAEPELVTVEVWETSNSCMVYVCRGGFMYKDDVAVGKWKKVEISVPSLDDI